MQVVSTTIIGHQPSGKCSLTGKDNVECFIVRVGDGEAKLVGVARLIEVLRWNCSITITNTKTKTVKESRDAD